MQNVGRLRIYHKSNVKKSIMKQIRCSCGSLLCLRKDNLFEYCNKKVTIVFESGLMECKQCKKIWLVNPFRIEPYYRESELKELKISYL